MAKADELENRIKGLKTSITALMRSQLELEKALRELQAWRDKVEPLLPTSQGKPHRERGPKAKLTQEQWLTQRREIAANARKSRWSKKATGRRTAKVTTTKESR